MKKPERLVGFVMYEDIEFSFEYNESSYELALYPPSQKVRYEKSNPFGLSSSRNYDARKHEWINNKRISGITSAGYNIIFDVQDLPSNYQGFISYQVNWFLCSESDLVSEFITGFIARGNDVNYFYPPQNAIATRILYKNDSQRIIDKMQVSSTEYKEEPCGQYQITENVVAVVTVSAFSTLHFNNWTNPIDSTSKLTTTFSTPVGIDTLIDAYYFTKQFLEFAAHRHNIILGDIEVISREEPGGDKRSGVLVFTTKQEAEKNKDAAKKIVQYHILTTKTSDLIMHIKDGSIGLQFLCDSIESTSSYPASRIILILSEFEREFRDIYGQDFGRSPLYVRTKQNIVDLIEKYADSNSGDIRNYANKLKKTVRNLDVGYGDRVVKALSDCEDILSVFTEKKYEGDYAKVIAGIGSRMESIRNGIAHSKIDIEFEAIHLCDIKMIEELIYAMRLKQIGITCINAQKAINSLFGEDIPL